MAEGRTLEIRTPKVYLPLLKPSRYKGVWGGRAGGKSWAMAELLIERHLMFPGTHSVCIREVQASLEQSVKRLLENKIQQMGVGNYFQVQDTKIHTPGNGLIIFIGMQNHTAESIKSLESYDTAWVEEAQVLSQRSLDLLRPTIRKEGSEIWFSWNPRDPKDPVDQFLRANPPSNAIVVKVNYYDNPWLPSVLLEEIEIDRKRDPDKFRHIWLGEYWNQGNARVFKNWTVEEFESPVGGIYRFGADWGYAEDPSVLVRSRLDGRRFYIDYEAYMVGCEIDMLPDLFDTVPGSRKFFITADSARPETISYMQRHGFPKMVKAKKGKNSVEDGIEFLKSYDIVVHPRCEHVIEELGRYSWKVDPLTNAVLPILEDKNNHCIAEGELVLCKRGHVPIQDVTTEDLVLTRDGYKRVLFSDVTDINRSVLCVETTVGTVRCTPDHQIYTGKGFVEAQNLSVGDEVIGESGGSFIPGHVIEVFPNGVEESVYDLTVEDKHEFFCNNILLSNCIDAVRYSCEAARKAERYKGLQAMPNVSYGVLDNVVGY